MKQKLYVYFIFLLISLWHTGIAADTSSIVAAIIPGVGQSKAVENTGTDAPIIVFEENHASVKGQIQQAMMLTRLHDNFKLNTIILEGYSTGSLDESAAKIRKLMSGSLGEIKENIAASLLAEGEISAVEFIKLVYPDLIIEKGETKTNSNIRKTVDEAEYIFFTKLTLALIAITEPSFSQPVARKFVLMLGSNLPVKTPQNFENVLNGSKSVIKQNSWTRSHDEILFPDNHQFSSIETEIKALDEIDERIKQLPPQLAPLAGSMDKFKDFLKARSAASDDLVNVAVSVAKNPTTPVLAMVIGAAHTEKVTELLKQDHVPYAVVRSLAMDSKDVVLSAQAIDKKMSLQSVSPLLGSYLNKAYPVNTTTKKSKPQPILDQDWLAAKTQFLSITDDLGKLLPAAGGSGGGNNDIPTITKALAGLPDDKFQGQYIYIDRKKIEVTKKNNQIVLLAPVTLNPNNPEYKKTIWIKIEQVAETERQTSGSNSKAETALRAKLEELSDVEGKAKPEKNTKEKVKMDKNKQENESAKKTDTLILGSKLGLSKLKVEQLRVSPKVAVMIAENKVDVVRSAMQK